MGPEMRALTKMRKRKIRVTDSQPRRDYLLQAMAAAMAAAETATASAEMAAAAAEMAAAAETAVVAAVLAEEKTAA